MRTTSQFSLARRRELIVADDWIVAVDPNCHWPPRQLIRTSQHRNQRRRRP